MRKSKIMKRITILCMAVVMTLGSSMSVFAVEPISKELDEAKGYAIEENANVGDVMPCDAQTGGQVDKGRSANFYPVMDSYIGFSQKINVNVIEYSLPASGVVTGTVKIILYKPNGDVRDSWEVTPGNMVSGTYTLPSSGTYRLYVENNSNIDVYVVAQWI